MPRLVALLALASCLASSTALAGNDDTYFMSSRASLVAGAVTAADGDAGCVWYNPAGLATITRQQLDLTLSVAAWQGRQIEDGLVSTVNGTKLTADLDGNRATIVSPATVFVRKLGKLTVGGGVFVSRDNVVDVSGRNEQTVGNVTGSSWAALDVVETRYHLGLATGFPVGERLRLGFGLFGIYDGYDADSNLALSAVDNASGERTDVQFTERIRSNRYEMEVTAGLQADLWKGLKLGFLVRSPIILLSEALDDQFVLTGNFGQVFESNPRNAASAGVLEPARLVLSVHYEAARWGLYAEGDWHHALRRDNLDPDPANDPTWLVDRESLWNLRAGAHWDVTSPIRLGAGFFTDRSANRRSQDPTDFDVDYYGVTLGAILTQRIDLADREREDDLLFRTSLSLRYAYGVGDVAQLRVDPATIEIDADQLVGVHFHELYVGLGSGLHF